VNLDSSAPLDRTFPEEMHGSEDLAAATAAAIFPRDPAQRGAGGPFV